MVYLRRAKTHSKLILVARVRAMFRTCSPSSSFASSGHPPISLALLTAMTVGFLLTFFEPNGRRMRWCNPSHSNLGIPSQPFDLPRDVHMVRSGSSNEIFTWFTACLPLVGSSGHLNY